MQLKYFSPEWCLSWPCPGYALDMLKAKSCVLSNCRCCRWKHGSQYCLAEPEVLISTVAALCGKRPVSALNRGALIRLRNFWVCAESKIMLCSGKCRSARLIQQSCSESLVRNPGLSKQVPVYCGEREGCWWDNWDTGQQKRFLLSPVLPCRDRGPAGPGNKKPGEGMLFCARVFLFTSLIWWLAKVDLCASVSNLGELN